MPGKICYLGDDHLQGAAAYLAGIFLHYGTAFDHVPSAEPPPAEFASIPYAAYVISDYPSLRLGHAAMAHIAARVEEGAGLLMIGGWESFHGRLGEYNESPLASVLPVLMRASDDRRNFPQPCLIEKAAEHEILSGLPWDQPPGIGGINLVTAKPGAETLLAAASFSVLHTVPLKSFRLAAKETGVASFSLVHSGEAFHFSAADRAPLLIVGRYGAGRTAALTTDVSAPLGRRFRGLGRPAHRAGGGWRHD